MTGLTVQFVGFCFVATLAAPGCDTGLSAPNARMDGSGGSGADGGADVAPQMDSRTDVDPGEAVDGLGCEGEAVDARIGACRLPLPDPPITFKCAASWAEQRTVGCVPAVVVFVSADSAPAGQLIWFERPWFSGGTSCFYDPRTETLVGAWYVSDLATHCCRTSYDVTYGTFDVDASEAANRAAQPWIGHLYDTSATVAVDGGEVRLCASRATAAVSTVGRR
jgi:hypothetical protein